MSVEVPEGWEQVQLSSIVDNKTTKWSENSNGESYIGLEHISQEAGTLCGVGSSSDVVSAKNTFEIGDVLFGKLRPNLKKFWRATFRGICSTDILVLRPGKKIRSDFLFALVQSNQFLDLAISDAVGTKMPRTSWSRLGELNLNLPPLPEQQRIAEILSSVDESIRATEAVIAQAERVKRGLMEDLLTGGLGSAAIANGEVPEGWDRNTLKELFVVKSSKRVFERQWRKEGIPFYRGREITELSENGRVDNDLFIDAELYEEFSRTNGVPKENDILITAIGTIGNTYLVDGSHKFYFKDASVLWLSSLNKAESKFINYWLKSNLFSSQRDIGNGTTVDSLTIGQLGGLQISFPPREDQVRIIEILSSVDDQITANRATVEQLQRLKRGLMDDLLTGKVRTVA